MPPLSRRVRRPAGGLLCVAAVIPGKGHDVLLDALATMTDLSWDCLCVGSMDRDPAFAERLRRRLSGDGIEDRVRFAGPRTGADLDRSYEAADLLVLPSRGETYGMVVTEALARGLPVVAADVGGVAETLGHGTGAVRPGLLVPADDPAALAAALRTWLGDAEVRLSWRRAARERRASLAGWSTTDFRPGRRAGGGGAMIAERTRVSGEPGSTSASLPTPRRATLSSAEILRRHLPSTGCLVIHDLGCGTGSMGRWLAPLLPGPQHWVLHDRDEDLLDAAAAELPGPAADGASVSVETRASDVTLLRPGDLADASLVTASALLDLLTRDELDRLIDVCTKAGCPVFLSLSVVGRVDLVPADPLDSRVAAAFDAHQRRMTERGRLLGPDAVAAAVEGFRQRGAEVLVRPTPWRLGAAEADLAAEWFTGWIGAACEQSVELASETGSYARRRLAEARAGELAVTVGHADLLVLP